MRESHRLFGLVVALAAVLALAITAPAEVKNSNSSGAASGNSGPSASGDPLLGADPGCGMRSWEDLYPGLNLTSEQKRQLADIRAETLRKVRAARDDLSVPPLDRMRRIGEVRRIARERELAVLTPEQREYMQQNPPSRSPLLDWQNRTPPDRGSVDRGIPTAPRNSAGLVPGVNDLTDEQTNRIAAIRRETQQRVQAAQRDRTLTPQQRAARIQQIQSDGHDRVMGVLTAEQRAAFQEQWNNRTTRGR